MKDYERGGVIQVTGGPVSLVMNNRTVLTFTPEGEVVFGEGIEPSEAAREFWTFLAHMNPLRGTVRKLEAENAAMRKIVQDVADAEVYHDSKGGMLIVATPDALVSKARALLAQQAE